MQLRSRCRIAQGICWNQFCQSVKSFVSQTNYSYKSTSSGFFSLSSEPEAARGGAPLGRGAHSAAIARTQDGPRWSELWPTHRPSRASGAPGGACASLPVFKGQFDDKG